VVFSLCVLANSVLALPPVFVNLQMQVQEADGKGLSGIYDITTQIKTASGTVLWEEVQSSSLILGGLVGVKLGTIVPLKSEYFYDQGTYISVKILNDVFQLSLFTTPFSMYAHGTDEATTLFLDNLINLDQSNKRVSIGSTQNAEVKLDILGGLLLGNTSVEVPGMIRFNNNHVQGYLITEWKDLDFEVDEEYRSKWTITSSDIYVIDKKVGINVMVPSTQLDVSGNGFISQSLTMNQVVMSGGKLEVGPSYEMNSLGDAIIKDMSLLSPLNYWDLNGLFYSGLLIGNGGGITNASIGNASLINSAIVSGNISNFSILGSKIAPQSIDSTGLNDAVITTTRLSSEFFLSPNHFATASVTNIHFQNGSITLQDLSVGFALDSDTVGDSSIETSKIVDYPKIVSLLHLFHAHT